MMRIQLRRDIKINWNEINPVLLQGEMGFEIDTNMLKVGDGITSWINLPYINVSNNLDLKDLKDMKDGEWITEFKPVF